MKINPFYIPIPKDNNVKICQLLYDGNFIIIQLELADSSISKFKRFIMIMILRNMPTKVLGC